VRPAAWIFSKGLKICINPRARSGTALTLSLSKGEAVVQQRIYRR
jgi:hypothetical protein